MEKRTVVITGGNSGLGYQCAKNIAMDNKNYTVVLACRNLDKATAAKECLQKETGNSQIYTLEMDLASLESIRNFYHVFCEEKYPPLFSLVCNAGIAGVGPDNIGHTKDGFEITFGVNHLGHFLLANLMLNQMVDNGRIVFVSSNMHEPPKLFQVPAPAFVSVKQHAYPEKNGEIQSNSVRLQYPISKLCNILCAYKMSDLLAVETDKHITVNAFNPDLMTDSNFMPFSFNPVLKVVMKSFISLFAASIGRLSNTKKSGKELAALITDSKYEGSTRKYYDRGKDAKSSGPSYDKTAARNLWIESAELVKLTQGESILSIT